MNMHKNARLTPRGRLLMVRRIEEQGWKVVNAALAAGLSERRASIWLKRYRAGGEIALHDRSSTPDTATAGSANAMARSRGCAGSA